MKTSNLYVKGFLIAALGHLLCWVGGDLLLATVAKGKTCLPKWAWLVNTLPLTLAAGVIFAGMGAMNAGSALMFFGLYLLLRKAPAAQ